MDYRYEVGTIADCTDRMGCCREESGWPTDGQQAAGKWGAFMCDTPEATVKNVLDYIVNEVKPDILAWTGDNTSHESYMLSSEDVTKYTADITQMIKEALKDTDITVLPIHGNHDTYFLDQQDISAPGIDDQINSFRQDWAEWLTEDAMEVFGQYGYYSMPLNLKNGKEVPSASKVIALNTNIVDQFNPYLLTNRQDPGQLYQWFKNELE